MNRYLFVFAISWIAACAPASNDTPPPVASASPRVVDSDSPVALLPTVPNLEAVGELDRAVGQDLFRLINGGAPMYIEHGFESVVMQSYSGADGVRFTVEIYQMKDAEGAAAVFEKKGGISSTEAKLGDASVFEGYYGLYVLGRYHFAVTASHTKGDLRAPIEELAAAVIANIAAGEGKPSP